MCVSLCDDGDQLSDAEWTAVLRGAAPHDTFREKYGEWLKQHTKKLMRACRKLGGGQKLYDRQTAAEELFCEVSYIALIRLPGALSGKDSTVRSVLGYVLSTCLRAAYEKLKFRNRNRSQSKPDILTTRHSDIEADGGSSDHQDRELPPDLQAEQNELAARAREAVAKLPPYLREIVKLHYYKGLTMTEIAERTGIPDGTVKGRHRRVKALLGPMLHWLVDTEADEPVLVG